VSGDIHVRGEVVVKSPIEISQKNNPDDESQNTRDKIRLVIEIVGLVLVAIYAYLTYWQASTTQNIFDAGNRPYVGPTPGSITFLSNDANSPAHGMTIALAVKNYGTAPGEGFTLTWEPAVSGVRTDVVSDASKPSTIFPGEVVNLRGTINGQGFYDIQTGKALLQFNVRIHYKGKSKTYDTCERQQYDPQNRDMIELGPICDTPWAKSTRLNGLTPSTLPMPPR